MKPNVMWAPGPESKTKQQQPKNKEKPSSRN